MKFRTVRRGLTLIEMLVVIGLVVTLAALAIPTVRLLTHDMRVREAGRDLQAFVQDAQNSARAEGQAGLWIERDLDAPNTSVLIYRIKTPPAYVGDFALSTCDVVNNLPVALFVDFPLPSNPSITLYAVAHPVTGADIQLDFKGPRYRIISSEGTTTRNGVTYQRFAIQPYAHSTGSLPPGISPNVKFKIMAQPSKQNLRQLTLPRNTYIDLALSGLTSVDLDGDNSADTSGVEFAVDWNDPNPGPIRIMFGSDGSVDWISSRSLAAPFQSGQTVYLLLAMDERGERGEFNVPANLEVANYPDLGDVGFPTTIANASNLWLTLGRNGRVTLSEMSDVSDRSSNFVGDVVRGARSLAIEQIQMQAN